MTAVRCPGCSGDMNADTLDGLYGRAITLDLCHACGAIWFDGRESLGLTPGAVLQLFERIYARASERRPLPAAVACPRSVTVSPGVDEV